MDTNWLRGKKGWIVAAILIFTPAAALAFKVIGFAFSIIGFILGLINPFGLFVAMCIAAFLIGRRQMRRYNEEETTMDESSTWNPFA